MELYNCAKVTGFEPGKVHIERNVSKGAPNPYNTWQPLASGKHSQSLWRETGAGAANITLEADLVVLAMGGRPDDAPYYQALAAQVAPEMYNIGDSFAGGRVLEANRAAYRLAREIDGGFSLEQGGMAIGHAPLSFSGPTCSKRCRAMRQPKNGGQCVKHRARREKRQLPKLIVRPNAVQPGEIREGVRSGSSENQQSNGNYRFLKARPTW